MDGNYCEEVFAKDARLNLYFELFYHLYYNKHFLREPSIKKNLLIRMFKTKTF